MSEIATIPGVGAVAGDRAVDWHYADGPIAINAVDARFFVGREFQRWPLVGRAEPRVWELIANGDAFLISSNMAHNLNVSVGDLLELDTPRGPLRRRVAGMVHDFLSPRGTVLMSRQLYARQWNDDKITHVLIRISSDADVASVRAGIARTLGSRYGLRILSTGELVEWFAAQVRRAFAGVYVLAIMVMLVVGFGIADTVATGVLERQRELGAMAALGVRRSRLGRMILIEASLIGIAGMLLALATGLTLGLVWVDMTFPDLVGWILELHVPARTLAGVTALAVTVCILAGAVPAVRSARVAPGPALRYE
jgi:putative ABC transport system permease protein